MWQSAILLGASAIASAGASAIATDGFGMVDALGWSTVSAPAPTPLPLPAFQFGSAFGSNMVLQSAPNKAAVYGYVPPTATEVTVSVCV